MAKASNSYLQGIDTQIELLENLNRRLEAMAEWEKSYPAQAPLVREAFKLGLALGEDLRSVGNKTERALSSELLQARYNQFVKKYEETWLEISRPQ